MIMLPMSNWLHHCIKLNSYVEYLFFKQTLHNYDNAANFELLTPLHKT